MALTTLQRVRLKIQDVPAVADVTTYGDGSALHFALQHPHVTSGSAFVPGAGGWSATGAAFASGWATLGTAISANSAVRFRYVHSVFSDDELEDWIGTGGSVNGAAVQAVEALMFDGLRRAAWRASDGTEYDDTKAIDLLKALHDKLKDEEHEAALGDGGFESWTVNQADW